MVSTIGHKNSSQIILGGIDTANYEAPMLIYEHDSVTDVQNLTPTEVSIVHTDGSNIKEGYRFPSLKSPSTVLLLGESDIRVPEYLYYWLIENMGATYQLLEQSSNKTMWFVDCLNANRIAVSLKIEFRNINITLTAEHLIGKVNLSYGKWQYVEGSYGGSATGEACRIFVSLSRDYDQINGNAPEADIYLGDPFFRAAYVWFDYQNNQTGLAMPKQDVRASRITGIRADGVIATVGEEGAAVLASNFTGYPSGIPGPPVKVLAGTIVSGIIFIGVVASLVFWFVLRKQNPPEMPPAPTAGLELEGQAKLEMPAKHGNCEVVGSGGYPNELPEEDQQEYRRELPASHASPAELPGSTALRSGRNSRDGSSSRDSSF
ncbi:hypothetical protein TWF192_007020 [Orbilia oligospora]|nr:hypothetical protein TWF192_007020 [Orbilia oligospora]